MVGYLVLVQYEHQGGYNGESKECIQNVGGKFLKDLEGDKIGINSMSCSLQAFVLAVLNLWVLLP
jgi:hypothetical protein